MGPKGRCYCGAVHLTATCKPKTVAVCHCIDCKRVTGAALAAFAAFSPDTVAFTPSLTDGIEVVPGVKRWFCSTCGSPLAATFDYLPGQIYVPIGILDNADDLAPNVQCYSNSALPWIASLSCVPSYDDSASTILNQANATP